MKLYAIQIVLKLKEFHNHPLYDPEDILKGYDIAVYIVDDEKLKVVVWKTRMTTSISSEAFEEKNRNSMNERLYSKQKIISGKTDKVSYGADVQ